MDLDARRLSDECRLLLARFEKAGVRPYASMSVLEARATVNAGQRLQSEPPSLFRVYDVLAPIEGGEIPVRIYEADPNADGPVVLYFHGGGWVTGGIETSDVVCRKLAIAAHGTVASVGYRLSPETKYPGPLHDCYAALKWLADGGANLRRGRRLVLCGDSAGGNLAAATSILSRDFGGPAIDAQALIYPPLVPDASAFGSQRGDASYGFSRQDMDWFWRHYLDEPGDVAYAAPLLLNDFSGLPPALMLVAEFDPLRGEGLAYASELRAAGGEAEVVDFPGLIHGFLSMDKAIPEAGWALERVGRWMADHADQHSPLGR